MKSYKSKQVGFSLVELLISMAIFSVILLLFSQMTSTSMRSLNKLTDRQSQFRESRAAFDAINARLSSAELSPYWGFLYPNGNTSESPVGYDLLSDLHFVMGGAANGTGSTPALIPGVEAPTHSVFFHGSFGRSEDAERQGFGTLMNAWGYYIEFATDDDTQADFLQTEGNIDPKSRFRLMELQVPSEKLITFQRSLGTQDQLDLTEAADANELFFWFREAVDEYSVPLAENIVALILTPLPGTTVSGQASDLAPNYYFDSRANQHSSPPVSTEIAEKTEHRLPPIIRVTMVAISEQSARLLAEQSGNSAPSLGLTGLFEDIDSYEADLMILEQELLRQRVDYRVFTNTIRLRNARWNQDN